MDHPCIARDDEAVATAARRVDPRRLTHALADVHDWVVMRCLEKNHARRYQSNDLTIQGMIGFFDLAIANNSNIIDSLFTRINCVLHSRGVDILVREYRRAFLREEA